MRLSYPPIHFVSPPAETEAYGPPEPSFGAATQVGSPVGKRSAKRLIRPGSIGRSSRNQHIQQQRSERKGDVAANSAAAAAADTGDGWPSTWTPGSGFNPFARLKIANADDIAQDE